MPKASAMGAKNIRVKYCDLNWPFRDLQILILMIDDEISPAGYFICKKCNITPHTLPKNIPKHGKFLKLTLKLHII
jgi:hypothetical protein